METDNAAPRGGRAAHRRARRPYAQRPSLGVPRLRRSLLPTLPPDNTAKAEANDVADSASDALSNCIACTPTYVSPNIALNSGADSAPKKH